MRFLTIFLIGILMFTNGCRNNPRRVNVEDEELSEINKSKHYDLEKNGNLLGSFSGDFADTKITILVTKDEPDSLIGRSIVDGTDRPFAGTIAISDNSYLLQAREPGGNKHDGKFKLKIDFSNPNILYGSWMPFDKSISDTISFTLHRREFKYLQDVGKYPMASKRLINAADIKKFNVDELELMRTEIYARHGYCFSRMRQRNEFETKDWYIPKSYDIINELTDIEKKNILFIKTYESN